ncbi:group I truncated hemoglobin [Microcoleus vaginatus]|uniref:group I truncated hemoglobin n=1 Tax=Microcoleus vaginatus TaxID=119532 RepID=UPI001F61F57C|nr:group 1 truncated hemoglobin [Microcoleus vaginatus HSN003]
MPTTLYEKMGGESAIKEMVDDFYRDVLADEIVSYFFDHTDMEKQRRHQTAFISYALGGSQQYSGRSMEKAHAGLNLQPEHFDAIVNHLTDAIIAHGASQEDLDKALAKIATLKDAVLYK